MISGSMRRKFSCLLLILLAFLVYAEDEKTAVVESTEELRKIKAKKRRLVGRKIVLR